MPLTFLLTQSIPGWQLTTATESVVVFKPISTLDPTAAICFVPRQDNPEKVYAILQGNGTQQDLFFQKEIEPSSYLAVTVSMHELMFQEEGFDL
jgi:hypothetical protein